MVCFGYVESFLDAFLAHFRGCDDDVIMSGFFIIFRCMFGGMSCHGYILAGGIPTPLKNMSSSVGMIIPNIWKI